MLYLGVTDANMDEGSLRCDANISLRRRGQKHLNPKTELKNLNSFRFLRLALRFEVERQSALLEAGEPLTQSTRLFDERSGASVSMRAQRRCARLPLFPRARPGAGRPRRSHACGRCRRHPRAAARPPRPLTADLGVSYEDAAVLVEERARADYFEALIENGASVSEANNWVRIEIGRWLNEHGGELAAFSVPAAALAGLLEAVRNGVVSAAVAGQVMDRMAETGGAAADIIAEEGLQQISTSDELAPIVGEVVDAHPEEVEAFRGGREQVFGFLMGQVIRATGGNANPDTVRDLLRVRLER